MKLTGDKIIGAIRNIWNRNLTRSREVIKDNLRSEDESIDSKRGLSMIQDAIIQEGLTSSLWIERITSKCKSAGGKINTIRSNKPDQKVSMQLLLFSMTDHTT